MSAYTNELIYTSVAEACYIVIKSTVTLQNTECIDIGEYLTVVDLWTCVLGLVQTDLIRTPWILHFISSPPTNGYYIPHYR